MTSLDQAAEPQARPIGLPKLAGAAALAAGGVWLFYGRAPGISAALFLAAVAIAAAAWSGRLATGRRLALAAIALAGGLLPLVYSFGLLPLIFGVGGAAVFLVVLSAPAADGPKDILASTLGLLVRGPFQIVADARRAAADREGSGWRMLRTAVLGWLVPLALSGVFILLFASANPVIDRWLAAFDNIGSLDTGHVILWLVLLLPVWGFVAYRRRIWPAWLRAGILPGVADASRFLGEAALLRSLILFNAIFAVETALDILYLWGGVDLPDGLTYAGYAHRGAYPLIVTALLAAGFVLLTMRPGGAGERSPLIRGLVFLWIGQNVFLVLSSILRLDLYVGVYSLTLLRSAAFIWMGLVAAGLVLIVARIGLRRSNAWLIGWNAAALVLVLYGASFVNFPSMVANFNLEHSREAGGPGVPFDFWYAVRGLGPSALPAIDRYLALIREEPTSPRALERTRLAKEHVARMQDWAFWTFRRWQLLRYIQETAAATEPGPAAGG
jgi:hypothetical protein